LGGSLQSFSKYPIKKWICDANPGKEATAVAIDAFTRSCAGCCVATYVIGIGDRHNDNIMLTKQGYVFILLFSTILLVRI
jgi:phosphatidylinositol kinase/protein kinase (PI-3  family)